jgi:DNA-directed RNA polymerase subunit L
MKVNITNLEKKLLEFEVSDCDVSILNYLVHRLNQNKQVEFAAYKMGHPLIGLPKMIVRTKNDDALDVVLEELKTIGDELSTFRKEFENAVK